MSDRLSRIKSSDNQDMHTCPDTKLNKRQLGTKYVDAWSEEKPNPVEIFQCTLRVKGYTIATPGLFKVVLYSHGTAFTKILWRLRASTLPTRSCFAS
jgi:hypothetical protein